MSPAALVHKQGSRDAIAKPRRPALAATHPFLYQLQRPRHQVLPSLPTDMLLANMELSSPKSSLTHFADQSNADSKPPFHKLHQDHVHFSQLIKDPRKITSAVPSVDDPKVRYLQMDIRANQPSVVSPTFMVALPCGELVEAAHVYEDGQIKKQRDSDIDT